MLFLGPPFGNYISLPNTISIKGSYTNEPRYGLISQIIKTLRYDYKYNGWVNKIGLRNYGIDYVIQKYNNNDDKNIFSIAILNQDEVMKIVNKIPSHMNIELNISCPNTEKNMIDMDIHHFINNKRKWCIIKVSPFTTIKKIDMLYEQGFRQFHCSNTLPIKNGGLSGPYLQQYNLPLINKIKTKYPDTIIIGGGGIRSIDDLYRYKQHGADHFCISTLCFSPLSLLSFYSQYCFSTLFEYK